VCSKGFISHGPSWELALQDLQVAIGIPHTRSMAVKTSPRRLADMGERSSSQCFLSDLSNMKVFAGRVMMSNLFGSTSTLPGKY
jgi:hypothetical protein